MKTTGAIALSTGLNSSVVVLTSPNVLDSPDFHEETLLAETLDGREKPNQERLP